MDLESTDLPVETSALVTIVFQEAGYVRVLDEIGKRAEVFVSATNLFEGLAVGQGLSKDKPCRYKGRRTASRRGHESIPRLRASR